MKAAHWSEFLAQHNACFEAVDWASTRSYAEAWEQCDDPCWMTWFLELFGTNGDGQLPDHVEPTEQQQRDSIPSVEWCKRCEIEDAWTCDQIRAAFKRPALPASYAEVTP